LELNVLELPKLPEQSDGTELYKWSEFFRSKTEEEFEMVAEKDPVIKKAVGTLMVLSEDEQERLLAESREKFLYDAYFREKDGYEKGLAESREKVLKAEEKARDAEEKVRDANKKAHQEKFEIIRRFKTMGVSNETIATAVQGFSPEEIAKV
jgi:predicted transposase/invertase (TIGR01784 family)